MSGRSNCLYYNANYIKLTMWYLLEMYAQSCTEQRTYQILYVCLTTVMVLLLPWWTTDSFESELKQKKISIPTHKSHMRSSEQAIIIKHE